MQIFLLSTKQREKKMSNKSNISLLQFMTPTLIENSSAYRKTTQYRRGLCMQQTLRDFYCETSKISPSKEMKSHPV